MKQITIVFFGIVVAITLIAISFTFRQASREQERLVYNLQQRSILLAESLRETIEPNFINKSESQIQKILQKFTDRERLAGLAVYDHEGTLVVVSPNFSHQDDAVQPVATNAMDSDAPVDGFITLNDQKMHLVAIPLHYETGVVGALMVVQNAHYITTQVEDIWISGLLRLLLQILFITTALFLTMKWLIYKPIRQLASSMKSARITGSQSADLMPQSFLFRPLAREFITIRRSLIEARRVAHEEARTNLERLDSPWTSERLHEFVNRILKDRTIVAISMGQPYNHIKVGNEISYLVPAGGLITAIEPIMQACGGTWIAAGGGGDADKLVVNSRDHVRVPPDEPKYTLRRVWLPQEDARRNYEGFCSEGMWALFHNAHNRPIFRKEDWEAYKKINGIFAQAILEEVKDLKRPLIFIQDFQFTLLPAMLKKARPDATVGVFWHIPWVSPESFSICPWKKEILRGMLGADLLGFHVPLYCNNFVESVNRELESLIDYENSTITHEDHLTVVKPFPISIAFHNDTDESNGKTQAEERARILKELGIASNHIGVGVERLDYTKGILERLKGIEIFLKKYPAYQGNFTFIQIAAPSRTGIARYQQLAQQVEEEVERINGLFQTRNWKPIVYLNRYHTHEEINRMYRLANLCLVTPLHDGMNLVAKEFIAARRDGKGVLILSQFTGAAQELKDALIINPYNGDETAEAIARALEMPPSEQTKRMRKLREIVRNNNIYRWGAEYLKTMMTLG